MKRSLFTLTTIATLGLALTGCSAGGGADHPTEAAATGSATDMLPQEIKDAGVLRLGSPATNQPYIFKNETSPTPVGLIPDLAAAVGEELGIKVEFQDVGFSGLIPALQADRIDAIWSVMSVSEERLQVISFVDYLNTARGFLVPAGNPKQIGDFSTLCGHTLGVLRGESAMPKIQEASEQCKTDGKGPIDIKEFDDAGTGRTQVQSGGADAWLGNLTPLKFAAKSVGDGTVFTVADFTFNDVPFGIGVTKDDSQLAAALQQALVELKNSGKYDEILGKYDASADALDANSFTVQQ